MNITQPGFTSFKSLTSRLRKSTKGPLKNNSNSRKSLLTQTQHQSRTAKAARAVLSQIMHSEAQGVANRITNAAKSVANGVANGVATKAPVGANRITNAAKSVANGVATKAPVGATRIKNAAKSVANGVANGTTKVAKNALKILKDPNNQAKISRAFEVALTGVVLVVGVAAAVAVVAGFFYLAFPSAPWLLLIL